jgi:hypothetical protein
MNKIKQWLMKKYCPNYEAEMPKEDDDNTYFAEAIMVWGVFGHRSDVVATKRVKGLRQAYIEARWLALKAQWMRPNWLFNCGINYGVQKI